jgi:triosephosphate isomerase
MHKTIAEARAFVSTLLTSDHLDDVEVVVIPPFTALGAVGPLIRGSQIELGAQTMHWEDEGAFTGEISPPMLVELEARYVLLGHSERRAYFGETDADVNRKVAAAYRHGLIPIVAVGETAEEHQAGDVLERVVSQTRAAFAGMADADIARSVVAYEPIWAIGSGQSETPEAANDTMGAIRAALPALADARIIYGGSAKPENIGVLCAQKHIDGALVGGASLDPLTFTRLIANAAEIPVRT